MKPESGKRTSSWADNLWTGWEAKAGEQLPRQMSRAVNETALVVIGGYGLLSTSGLNCVWVGCSTQQEIP